MSADMARLTELTTDQLDAYQGEILKLTTDLTESASEGRFRDAGEAFTRLLECQDAFGMLPDRHEFDAIRAYLAALNRMPGRIAGVSG